MERNAHMSKLEARVKELENKVELLTGMILGVTDRITDMDLSFSVAVMSVRDLVMMATLPHGKKIPKASQGGSSVRSSKPNTKRQANLRAEKPRSSRKKG